MMETTPAYLRRQGRLMMALLELADDHALALFERHLRKRIELLHGSVFPWLERRVGHFSAIDDLQEREHQLMDALASQRLTELRSLLERYLREEDEVVSPMIEFHA